MSYFRLGREVYSSEGVSKVAVAIDDKTAKMIVDTLNATPKLLLELERSTRALEWWKANHFLEWDAADDEQLQNNRAAIAKANGATA